MPYISPGARDQEGVGMEYDIPRHCEYIRMPFLLYLAFFSYLYVPPFSIPFFFPYPFIYTHIYHT